MFEKRVNSVEFFDMKFIFESFTSLFMVLTPVIDEPNFYNIIKSLQIYTCTSMMQ